MPIYWTTDRHVCEGCEAAFTSDDELQSRCPTCEAAYQRDYAEHRRLAGHPSRYDAEGMAMRLVEMRGGRNG